MTALPALLEGITRVARLAGEEIMRVYAGDEISVEHKADCSPVTEADTRANRLIMRELHNLSPQIPVLSEESVSIPWETRQQWHEYWLVDPLDGTKEFINRNDEFTVNIALIRDGVPVLGVVYAPALETIWQGLVGVGAWKQEREGTLQPIAVKPLPASLKENVVTVVASRRHGGDALQGLLASLATHFQDVREVNMGSSLKICLVAEGSADLYPRLAPTSEWDTAAAQAVLAAAGGDIVKTDLTPLRYNSEDNILNPHFLALGDVNAAWRTLLGSSTTV